MEDLVSVIIPVHNAEKFISYTVDSVLNQTCADFEIILCENNSTDATREIIAAMSDPRIKVLNLKDVHDAAGARNAGVKEAAGRYYNALSEDDGHGCQQQQDPSQSGVEPSHQQESTTELYSRIMFGDRAKKSYRVFFELLLENPPKRSVVFHSVYGRDRTGVAAALLLTALDVPENTIIEDYLLTKGVFAHTLRYVLSLAGVEYGSVTEYLKKFCKLTDTDIMTLKHKYLS